MNSDDGKKRLREISRILSILALMLVLAFLSMQFEDKLPSAGKISPVTVIFLFVGGYIHFRYSDAMAYLYNRNRFGPRMTPQRSKIFGIVFWVATAVCIGVLALKWM